jgi:hypothetical protein
LATVHHEPRSHDALPVCLDSENPNRLVGSCDAATEVYSYWKPLDAPLGPLMEFRLLYNGPLPSETNRSHPLDKHRIRRAFHPQLKELWSQHKILRDNTDVFAQDFERRGFRFIPLVRERLVEICSLDILFLRRDHPGNLIRHGGDIDNRLKVLFDGLRIPESGELPSDAKPEDGEDPFFCLLKDDELITEVKVTTDRLFVPKGPDEGIHDVVLVIHVKAYVAGVDGSDFATIHGKIVTF